MKVCKSNMMDDESKNMDNRSVNVTANVEIKVMNGYYCKLNCTLISSGGRYNLFGLRKY